ncbi:hypothetical protein D0862_10469 [Hortaea werneckii]|uniref:Uncharacterized protein n=1 Tax=Hortaea werneckii TaxID=91943 RepID=A0A3M7FHH1_HORWE|nr:hypothetical protein D0862_10469 [Hortaea werneckii]
MEFTLTHRPAQPQRPRALRVHDENAQPPPVTGNVPPGKTLHHRTKSTPAFSTLLQAGAVRAASKKVLGEANANLKIVRDDSEIGKASPAKGAAAQEPVKPQAAFTRPAPRPLAPKNPSTQNMPTTTTTQAANRTAAAAAKAAIAAPEPVKKMGPKKSTKVLREVQPGRDAENQKPVTTTVPVHQPLAAPKPTAAVADKPTPPLDREIRRMQSIPLRDEPVVRPQANPATINHSIPPGFVSEQDYANFLAAQNASHIPPHAAYGAYPVGAQYAYPYQPPVEHFYDAVEGEEYYYEDSYVTPQSFNMTSEPTGGVTEVLEPKVTDKVLKELEAARCFVEATRSPEDVEDEQWDMSMVAEYGDEIFSYMRNLENRMAPNPRYMEQQQEIQWSMRSVLIDWVVQVHQRFNLLPETLFLTVNYIDRFLSCKIVSLGKLQLVGATAIFVAAKYEEVQCPTIGEIIYMVDGGYSADELFKAERFMLSMLQFELGWPGPMSFLRRISKADDYDLETRTLAKYFLEVTLMDERFVGCVPSFLAAGAHCMARLMLRKGDWGPAHVFYSQYTYTQLRDLLAAMLECCELPEKHHNAVFEKYMDKRYKKAANFVVIEMEKGFTVPGVTRGPIWQ